VPLNESSSRISTRRLLLVWRACALVLFNSVPLLAARVAHAADNGPAQPCASSTLELWKFWLSIVGYLGALGAFVIGLRQYRRADYWRRSEFLAREMKEYFADPKVNTALTMIDWGIRKVRLYEDSSAGGAATPAETRVDRKMQCDALRPHTMLSATGASDEVVDTDAVRSAGASFTPDEAAIRDCYDRFLDGLERLGNYLSGDLVSIEDVKAYVEYWIESIADTNCDGDDAMWTVCLLAYIDFYAFIGVQMLFSGFGHDIRVKGELVKTFAAKSSDKQRVGAVIAHVIAAKSRQASNATLSVP
jgi:hypothetical protein